MSSCLIRMSGNGLIMDSLYASKVAEELDFDQVDMLVNYSQVVTLLRNSPYIDRVFWSKHMVEDFKAYDKIIDLSDPHFAMTPVREYMTMAGIPAEHHSDGFNIYISEEVETYARNVFSEMRSKTGDKPIVGIQESWITKSFIYTEEDYEARQRAQEADFAEKAPLERIMTTMSNDAHLIMLGKPANVRQWEQEAADPLTFECQVAFTGECDYVIGHAGTFTTIAASLGVPTIVDTSSSWLMYGPNGVRSTLMDGPKHYPSHMFDTPSVEVGPYLTPDDLQQTIAETIFKG